MNITGSVVVSMRYIMKNGTGDILENTMNSHPATYLHGSTGILPLLQTQLEGLKEGDKKVVYLTAASGLTNEDFIFEVTIDEVRGALKEELLLGYPIQLNVTRCEADCDCYKTDEDVTKEVIAQNVIEKDHQYARHSGNFNNAAFQ